MSNMEVNELVASIQKDWSLVTKPLITEDQLIEILANEINRMIRDQFSWLIHLLYRIDISEQKLRALLAENKNADAGKVIAYLIVERQKQKIAFRKSHPPKKEDIPDEDRW
jgi:hypothetical protein